VLRNAADTSARHVPLEDAPDDGRLPGVDLAHDVVPAPVRAGHVSVDVSVDLPAGHVTRARFAHHGVGGPLAGAWLG